MRHTVKHLARKNTKKAVQDLLGDSQALETVASMLGKHIFEKEIAYISSPATLSTLYTSWNVGTITKFKWEDLWLDIANTAPAMSAVLLNAVPSHKAKDLIPSLCIIVAMLAKARNRRLDVVQEILSLILHTGHASTQVQSTMYSHTWFIRKPHLSDTLL